LWWIRWRLGARVPQFLPVPWPGWDWGGTTRPQFSSACRAWPWTCVDLSPLVLAMQCSATRQRLCSFPAALVALMCASEGFTLLVVIHVKSNDARVAVDPLDPHSRPGIATALSRIDYTTETVQGCSTLSEQLDG
jgi:hypothetical protein